MINEFIIVIIGAFMCIGAFIYLEKLHRKGKFSPELLRRSAHIVSSLVASIFSIFLSQLFFVGALCFFFLIMVVSRRKGVFNHIHKVSRPTIGEELLPLGFVTSYLIAGGHQNIYLPAFLIVGCADPVTGIIMERYRNHFVGILVFFFIAIFILFFFKFPLVYIFIVATIAALVERISGYGTDNLTVPTVIALLLLLAK